MRRWRRSSEENSTPVAILNHEQILLHASRLVVQKMLETQWCSEACEK
jgi:hypothetical protein